MKAIPIYEQRHGDRKPDQNVRDGVYHLSRIFRESEDTRMKKKTMRELKPGEIFLDSFGLELKVVSVKIIDDRGLSPTVKVSFITQRGLGMFQHFPADRMVSIK